MKNSFFPAFICCMVANVLAGQCGISFETTMLPMVVTDCDASQSEPISWELPKYKVGPGFGPAQLVQISSPPPGTESPPDTFDANPPPEILTAYSSTPIEMPDLDQSGNQSSIHFTLTIQ